MKFKNKLSRKRISTLIDLLILIMLFSPVIILDLYLFGNYDKIQSYNTHTINIIKDIFVIYLTSITLLYLLKDSINGQSPGKRIVGIAVTDINSGKSNVLQNLFRNLIGLFSFGDILLAFLYMRRIGDIFCNTEIIDRSK